MSNLPALTSDQLALIKSTVAKNATDDELALFLYRCKELNLDPLKPGQIFFMKYGTGPGTIVIGRDGFRTRAALTGLHTGTKVGIIRNDKGHCVGAWCEVYRKDWSHPAREEVALAEYTTGKNLWQKMPETMIKKVAEVAALRMAFPDQLAGLYSHDEMDQAEPLSVETAKSVRIPVMTMDQVAKERHPGVTDIPLNKHWTKEDFVKDLAPKSVDKAVLDAKPSSEYVSKLGQPNGKLLGKRLCDVSRKDLLDFMKWLRMSPGGPTQDYLASEATAEFIFHCEQYLNDTNIKKMLK